MTIDMGAQTGMRALGGVQSRSFKLGGQETMSDVDLSKLTGEGQEPEEFPSGWNQVKDRVACRGCIAPGRGRGPEERNLRKASEKKQRELTC